MAAVDSALVPPGWRSPHRPPPHLPPQPLSTTAHFLLRWRATSDFLKPSRLKRRLARRPAASVSDLPPLRRQSAGSEPGLPPPISRAGFSLHAKGGTGSVAWQRVWGGGRPSEAENTPITISRLIPCLFIFYQTLYCPSFCKRNKTINIKMY